jgi:hypothetical protein
MNIPITTPGAFVRAQTPIAGVLWRLVAVGALAVTLFAVTASAASAGSHERILTKGGAAWFDHSGEYIVALDRRKDGYSVRTYLLWVERRGDDRVPRTEEVVDNTGFTPGPVDPRRGVYRQISVPEGTPVRLIMCYAKGDLNRRCSQPQQATA